MNFSFGEFRSLTATAFRGAGYSWGLTEDAAYASMRLAEFDIDAGAAVARLLTRSDGVDKVELMPTMKWESVGDMLCPICVGTAIIDLGVCPDVPLRNLIEPILLAPFLLSMAESESGSGGYLMQWQGGYCEISQLGISLEGAVPEQGADITITEQSPSPSLDLVRSYRVELDVETEEVLHTFAYRTYAPATKESRLTGAGAGLLDED